MFPDAITSPSSIDPKEWVDEQDRLALKAFKNWKKEILKDNKPSSKSANSGVGTQSGN